MFRIISVTPHHGELVVLYDMYNNVLLINWNLMKILLLDYLHCYMDCSMPEYWFIQKKINFLLLYLIGFHHQETFVRAASTRAQCVIHFQWQSSLSHCQSVWQHAVCRGCMIFHISDVWGLTTLNNLLWVLLAEHVQKHPSVTLLPANFLVIKFPVTEDFTMTHQGFRSQE